MRLINADQITGFGKYIKTNSNFEPYIMIDDLVKVIDNQPTAYSVDKVVEELEEAKGNVPVNRLLDDIIKEKPKELGQLIAYNKAIEIVKQGGVSDDVCEWNGEQSRLVTYTRFTTACGYSFDLQTDNELLKAFRYCPFCGKKIKVAE